MLNAVRTTARAQSLFSSTNIVTRKPSGIRFASGKMDPKQGSESKTRDSNISSLGEGYASRSDEDGFGGTCGGTNQAFKDDGEQKNVHGKDTGFDHSQGSEVKEKEDARNQKNVKH